MGDWFTTGASGPVILALCLGLTAGWSHALDVGTAQAQSCSAAPSWALELASVEGPADVGDETWQWPDELWLDGADGDHGFISGESVALELRRVR